MVVDLGPPVVLSLVDTTDNSTVTLAHESIEQLYAWDGTSRLKPVTAGIASTDPFYGHYWVYAYVSGDEGLVKFGASINIDGYASLAQNNIAEVGFHCNLFFVCAVKL